MSGPPNCGVAGYIVARNRDACIAAKVGRTKVAACHQSDGALIRSPGMGRLSAACCIIALLTACGTTGIKPEEKLVSSVTSLPPVQVPVPVRCVKEIPPMPTLTIDPNATVLQRYYAMKALLAAQDEYMLRANAVIQGCAAEPAK